MNIIPTLSMISQGYRHIIGDIETLFDDPEYESVFRLTEKAALESIRIRLLCMKREIDTIALKHEKELALHE